MGHTNSTANIALPQFIGTDKPTWLGDVNGAFSAIDSKVGTIDADISAVDAKADNAVADASNAVTTATNANNTAGTASTTATNALNVANNALTVANNADGHTNQLETKIGLLADLTTTDKTSIVNAINEVNAASAPTASAVSYDNTGSGLTAANVQDAIDELAQGGSGAVVLKTVTADGSKTYAQILTELFSEIGNITSNSMLEVIGSTYTNVFHVSYYTSSMASFSQAFNFAASANINTYEISASGKRYEWAGSTINDDSSTVVTTGTKFNLYK